MLEDKSSARSSAYSTRARSSARTGSCRAALACVGQRRQSTDRSGRSFLGSGGPSGASATNGLHPRAADGDGLPGSRVYCYPDGARAPIIRGGEGQFPTEWAAPWRGRVWELRAVVDYEDETTVRFRIVRAQKAALLPQSSPAPNSSASFAGARRWVLRVRVLRVEQAGVLYLPEAQDSLLPSAGANSPLHFSLQPALFESGDGPTIYHSKKRKPRWLTDSFRSRLLRPVPPKLSGIVPQRCARGQIPQRMATLARLWRGSANRFQPLSSRALAMQQHAQLSSRTPKAARPGCTASPRLAPTAA